MLQARIGKLSTSTGIPLDQLDRLFRMEAVKKQIEKLKKTWSVARGEGDGIPDIGHFVFTGSPGTGKTTVASTLASVLFGLQLKASDKLVETTALDLQGDYLGQTKTKVQGLLEEAKGGCLFIDEFCSFEGQFGKEAIDALVAAMTSPDYRDLQIRIAGYPADVDEVFRKNSGLKSRFQHFFQFPDWTPEDSSRFFALCAESDKFRSLDKAILDGVRRACTVLVPLDGWANGRDVMQLYNDAKSNRAERVFDSPELDKILLEADVAAAIKAMLESRQPKIRKALKALDDPRKSSGPLPAAHFQGPSARSCTVEMADEVMADECPEESTMEADHGKSCNTPTTEAEQEELLKDEEQKDNGEGHASRTNSELGANHEWDERDEGVTDQVWDELQACIGREEQERKDLLRMKEEIKRAMREEQEARQRYEEELARIQAELEKEEQERARREAEEMEARRRAEEDAKQRKFEEQLRRKEEMLRKREEIKQKLRTVGPFFLSS
ncbi:hypothetical protein ACA910_019003 [Epithemia clementina (nom. ined.)]